MEVALAGRPMADYTRLERPDVLPPELVFREGDSVPTRKATEAWFAWAMQRTAFFYLGAGDLMKSILTGKAENVYGIVDGENPLGRGIRFGIAEQNMAMMSCAIAQDTLPGGFRPMTAFATYGVFTPMMANSVRMTLINSAVNPARQLLHHAGRARRAGDRRGRPHPSRPVLDVAVHGLSRHQGLQAAGRQRGGGDAVLRRAIAASRSCSRWCGRACPCSSAATACRRRAKRSTAHMSSSLSARTASRSGCWRSAAAR